MSTSIRGCSSLCCTNQATVGANIGWLVQFLPGWCSSCQVGALETSAPLKSVPPKKATPEGTCYGHKKRSPKSFDSEDLK